MQLPAYSLLMLTKILTYNPNTNFEDNKKNLYFQIFKFNDF